MTNTAPKLDRTKRRRARAVFALCAAAVLAGALPAVAQNWWPFGGNNEPRRPPVPREPVYRPEPGYDQPPPGQQAPAPNNGGGATNWSTKNPICLQLEQRLVVESQKGSQWRDQLPKIEAEMREADRTFNVGQSQLDKRCYEYFLFTKSFRGTPQCRDLQRQVEGARQRLAELEAKRQELTNSGGRSYQDDIIRELARNNCGANYVDQARRRDGGFWQDEESIGNNTWTPQGSSGVATYRTLCVRLCDGYYFPVSFSTLPSHFPQDANACSSKCAAPTELYYYPNPGGSVDQSVALTSQTPYTTLKTAFRYRKEYVNGCSCKEAEYDSALADGQKKADASGAGSKAPQTSASAQQGVETAPLDPPLASDAASDATVPADSGWQPQ